MLLYFSLACLWFTDYSRWLLLRIEYSMLGLFCLRFAEQYMHGKGMHDLTSLFSFSEKKETDEGMEMMNETYLILKNSITILSCLFLVILISNKN